MWSEALLHWSTVNASVAKNKDSYDKMSVNVKERQI